MATVDALAVESEGLGRPPEGRAGRLAAPYSPKCLEVEFCELRLDGILEL
jgi:hypothetical protein